MRIAVVGLGTMGLGIVQVLAGAGHEVVATDAVPAARDAAMGRLRGALDALVARGRLEDAAAADLLVRVRIVDGVADLSGELAIEAVAEDLAVKRSLFAALERVLGPEAVLATNTSSLSVAAVGAGMEHPERLVGLHFFNPAPVMRLVEVIPHAGSSPAALVLARRVAEAAGKVVVEAPDRPGFIVNRCARPFYGEALAIVEEGRAPAEVEAAMLASGYRIGPFGLIDLIGADINLAATEGLNRAMGGHPRYHIFNLLRESVAAGALGRKTGRGLLWPETAGAPPADTAAIALRIEAMLANEAGWLLSEGGVTREAIDTAVTLGLNFPRGPFAMLAAHGGEAVRAELARCEDAVPDALRGRYLPAPAILDAP